MFFSLADNYTEFDPCTDFDKLACNGFRAKRAPSPGSGQASTFTSEPVRVTLKYILEGPYPSGPGNGFISESLSDDQIAVDRDNFKLVTDAYNACLKNTAVEEAGLEPLISIIDHIGDAFPKKASSDLITESDDLGKVLLIFAQLSIPTFELQPLYDVGYPSYINYGGLGAVLGHELTHGFDNTGHNYAPNGSLANWFKEASEKAFADRAQCFAWQYSRFSVATNGTRVPVRGNATLGENIADAGGLVTVFAAWKHQKADGKTKDYDLLGLGGFTHDQLFFVQYAQGWCNVSGSPAYDVWLVNNDVHSPGHARINGPLSNSVDFIRAFNCPVREVECMLW
ncbi:hypothetical protein LZ30DRAFT_781426 [Colletotrichum cereale]|nr:hypothetical protein LZ30DRAFT_781426 [Colletotrichum cereale]